MADLRVHLNRDAPDAIEAPATFESAGGFDVVLDNHGTALHVHLRLDDDLSAAARLGTANHYVEAEAVRRVRVDVDEERLPADGRLEIVTRYGAETAYVRVSIDEPGAEDRVDVDERLARPPARDDEPLVDPEHLPALALLAVALPVAALAVLTIGDPVVGVGVAAAVLALAVAGALLAR